MRAAIKAHLQREAACFEFGVQVQKDPQTMPIEDASVIWDEDVSPFQTVATLTIEHIELRPAQQCVTAITSPEDVLSVASINPVRLR